MQWDTNFRGFWCKRLNVKLKLSCEIYGVVGLCNTVFTVYVMFALAGRATHA